MAKLEKNNLYLLSIVGIVAIVGIVVLVLNTGNGIETSSELDSIIVEEETDLTGQAATVKVKICPMQVCTKNGEATATQCESKAGVCICPPCT